MSSVSASGNPDTPRGRVLARIAHLQPYALAVWLAASMLLWVDLLPTWLNTTIVIAAITVIAVEAGHRRHGGLCALCIDSVPPDAPVQAQRRQRLLHLAHHSNAALLLYLALFATPATALIVFDLPHSWGWLFAPADILFATVLWSGWVHHRLRPWCPYCRDWDDDDAPAEPTPDPAPSNTPELTS